ncbi:hypothetical protein APHAL10511_006628 [Amanita phalloides]|nr:hypothetical protein APHAL10511_006628 [Amanita phalloides]
MPPSIMTSKHQQEQEGLTECKQQRLENMFLDVEAFDGRGSNDPTEEEEETSPHNFIDDSTVNSSDSDSDNASWVGINKPLNLTSGHSDDKATQGIDKQTSDDGSQGRITNQAPNKYSCLEHVITHYEAHRIECQGEGVGQGDSSDNPDDDKEDNENELNDFVIDKNIVGAAHTIMSNHVDEGMHLWRVHVHEGTESESCWLMCEQLRVRPQYAKAILSPSQGLHMYVLMEVSTYNGVEELCKNLSTVWHPVDITHIPESKHQQWTKWQLTPPTGGKSPSPVGAEYGRQLCSKSTKLW